LSIDQRRPIIARTATSANLAAPIAFETSSIWTAPDSGAVYLSPVAVSAQSSMTAVLINGA
jgi:hypothetical protein